MNKEKSLIIFNKNGTTLEFEKVTNFVEIAGNCTIAFTYPEASTQKRREQHSTLKISLAILWKRSNYDK
ncbi:hypothetical protein [Enterococcus faecalis]|uniref:hypothetical protein n=1 Tax=Enterococcus faecalis TaxID=1351 RepID=UPI00215D5D4D|nr:hypothetical protein [Enterococcus faecalis]